VTVELLAPERISKAYVVVARLQTAVLTPLGQEAEEPVVAVGDAFPGIALPGPLGGALTIVPRPFWVPQGLVENSG